MTKTPRNCPHCESRLRKWRVPDETTWNEEFFYVCFNDECPYFQKGWVWMKEQYAQASSYRYMVNPTTGCPAPLPVWSPSAMRDLIVEDDEEGTEEGGQA